MREKVPSYGIVLLPLKNVIINTRLFQLFPSHEGKSTFMRFNAVALIAFLAL